MSEFDVVDGGNFVDGWDIVRWDGAEWDSTNNFDTGFTGNEFTTTDENTYTSILFNSPYFNGCSDETYLSGVKEIVVIKKSELNIPNDIDINTYTINQNLIGQEVTAPSGTVTVKEKNSVIILSGNSWS